MYLMLPRFIALVNVNHAVNNNNNNAPNKKHTNIHFAIEYQLKYTAILMENKTQTDLKNTLHNKLHIFGDLLLLGFGMCDEIYSKNIDRCDKLVSFQPCPLAGLRIQSENGRRRQQQPSSSLTIY